MKLDHVVCHGDQVLPVHLPGSGGDSITAMGDVVTRRHDSFQYWWAERQLNDQKDDELRITNNIEINHSNGMEN